MVLAFDIVRSCGTLHLCVLGKDLEFGTPQSSDREAFHTRLRRVLSMSTKRSDSPSIRLKNRTKAHRQRTKSMPLDLEIYLESRNQDPAELLNTGLHANRQLCTPESETSEVFVDQESVVDYQLGRRTEPPISELTPENSAINNVQLLSQQSSFANGISNTQEELKPALNSTDEITKSYSASVDNLKSGEHLNTRSMHSLKGTANNLCLNDALGSVSYCKHATVQQVAATAEIASTKTVDFISDSSCKSRTGCDTSSQSSYESGTSTAATAVTLLTSSERRNHLTRSNENDSVNVQPSVNKGVNSLFDNLRYQAKQNQYEFDSSKLQCYYGEYDRATAAQPSADCSTDKRSDRDNLVLSLATGRGVEINTAYSTTTCTTTTASSGAAEHNCCCSTESLEDSFLSEVSSTFLSKNLISLVFI